MIVTEWGHFNVEVTFAAALHQQALGGQNRVQTYYDS